VSKIFTLFQPNFECGVVVPSYTVLKRLQSLLPKVLELSPVDKSTKKALVKTLHSTLEDSVLFSSNTLGRLFLFPYDADLAKIFLRENYYNMLNILRMWEFTILDLLQVP